MYNVSEGPSKFVSKNMFNSNTVSPTIEYESMRVMKVLEVVRVTTKSGSEGGLSFGFGSISIV